MLLEKLDWNWIFSLIMINDHNYRDSIEILFYNYDITFDEIRIHYQCTLIFISQ